MKTNDKSEAGFDLGGMAAEMLQERQECRSSGGFVLGRLTAKGLLMGILACGGFLWGQEPDVPEEPGQDPVVVAEEASVTTTIGANGGRLVVEATGLQQKVPSFYTGSAESLVRIGEKQIDYRFRVTLRVLQGDAKVLSLGLVGPGEIVGVTGPVKSWAVRQEGEVRYLEIRPSEELEEYQFEVTGRQQELALPLEMGLLRLSRGKAVNLTDHIRVSSDPRVSARVSRAVGYAPVEDQKPGVHEFVLVRESGVLDVVVERGDGLTAPAELTGVRLEGVVNGKDGFASFVLTGVAEVREDDSSITLLHGQAAVEEFPQGEGYRLVLHDNQNGVTSYRLEFEEAGSYPVRVAFVARVVDSAEWSGFDFGVPGGAVVPLMLTGIPADSEFHERATVVPSAEGEAWRGFLPISGSASVAWKPKRKAGDGKLFFTTEARVNLGVGAGLLRQDTEIAYKILQGKLEELTLVLNGPGEVLAVEGTGILGWEVREADGGRTLQVRLSQPIEDASTLRIRSQLALGAFPVRAAPLRVDPEGAIRHSGYIRVYNIGATRLEVAGLSGLTQLAPEQFPVENMPGGDRQVFVYRFPAVNHSYEVVASRVEPEVQISEVVVYELSESDRIIRADVEMDIREAALRSGDMLIPEDYTVVSVVGAEVADYVPATEVSNGMRNLKVFFSKEVIGRQLVSVQLEKNIPAAAGEWVLPRLEYPGAKSVRGDIGVASVPGYRIVVGTVDKLSEKPVSYFPLKVPRLQQAFRIRERDWSGSVMIERLEQSVQADLFHLYSLKDQTAYASVVLNYFITGAPVTEWRVDVPEEAGNISVEGQDVRTWRREENQLVVTLHQPVIGAYTLLVTYEEAVGARGGEIFPGRVAAVGVRGERGFIQVVSPVQVNTEILKTSPELLRLDALELPAEFRLLSAAPSKATYQYTSRPFELVIGVQWFDPGDTVTQVVGFAEAGSRVSRDGEVVTDVSYSVKTRGRGVLRATLPEGARLWAVTVNGESVNAREDGKDTVIPLPAGVDANAPVEVKLRLGTPAGDGAVKVSLPAIHAPVMKAEWSIRGEAGRVLVPRGGDLTLDEPVLSETGLEWIAGRALLWTAILAVFLAAGVCFISCKLGGTIRGIGGILCLVVAMAIAGNLAVKAGSEVRGNLETLEYTLSAVTPEQSATVLLDNETEFAAAINTTGLLMIGLGVGLFLWSFIALDHRIWFRLGGAVLLMVGILIQRGGAQVFYGVVIALIVLLLLVGIYRVSCEMQRAAAKRRADRAGEQEEAAKKAPKKGKKKDEGEKDGPLPGGATASLLLIVGLLLSWGGQGVSHADKAEPAPIILPAGFAGADAVKQSWSISEGRLKAEGTLTVSGEAGARFLLLRGRGVMTAFEGAGLHVGKENVSGFGACYVVTIRGEMEGAPQTAAWRQYEATFAYEMPVVNLQNGVAVPTGPGSVQQVEVRYDKAGWEFDSTAAMKVSALEGLGEGESGARLLLSARAETVITLRPKRRDVTAEAPKYFVEASNLFLPSPGVVDSRHLLQVRPSQGEVDSLTVNIPKGFTVSNVEGRPVGTWQFDADAGVLNVVLEPAQSGAFSLLVETQGSLDPLPSEVTLSPVSVPGAANEVGLFAVAFGSEAQPEDSEPTDLSPVNLADFDEALIPEHLRGKVVLHRVYRYGQSGGSLALRVASVAPEVRVTTQEVLSIGDERLVLGVNFTADITRAGVFQLSFPVPAGMEVESLSGPALNHWSELTEEGVRYVILHLNGKTLGAQQFALSLAGVSPSEAPEGWTLPRFGVREAKRQTGQLVVKPTPGIRLRTLTRKNVSEVDPRSVGGQGEGALAFRVLQKDWELSLGIEKLDPWVTGQILHELTLREGQTRSSILAKLKVENASIRSLQVRLPGLSEEEAKTVRASGTSVGDVQQVEGEDGVWLIQFKRRMLGDIDLRLEFERTGERAEETEKLAVLDFPELRQASYYVAVRAGARMELSTEVMPKGWQRVDWNAVPQVLRESGDRSIPALSLRAVVPEDALEIGLRRHSVAESLKLRVVGGEFITLVSPVGQFLTSVDLAVLVVQRSTLEVTLPKGGDLYNVFVNGESVSVVREGEVYQFYILPGADDKSAQVRFVYSLPGQDMRRLKLDSPKLNVPLENIRWRVVVPADYHYVSSDGDLDLTDEAFGEAFDRKYYLAATQSERQEQVQQAEQLLEQANDWLQSGEQTKARLALNSVANNYSLDAASNEDTRVQLRELQTQQAIVGLNTRRQRLYLDNKVDDQGFERNAQLETAAARNGIINDGEVRFRPQDFGAFLEGNTKEDNAVLAKIATRLVTHQRSSEPAPQAISVIVPEEGRVLTFSRSVQVNENEPLELDLKLKEESVKSSSREALVLLVLFAMIGVFYWGFRRKVVG